jgi:hypothetical protein
VSGAPPGASYTLTSNPNGYFAIQNGNQLVEAINTPAGTYSIGIHATAPGVSVTQQFTLNYAGGTNPFHPPAGVGIVFSGLENQYPVITTQTEFNYYATRGLTKDRLLLGWSQPGGTCATVGIQPTVKVVLDTTSTTCVSYKPFGPNILINTQAFASAPWSTSAGSGTATIVNNAAIGPDGTTTASSLTDTAASGSFLVGHTLSGNFLNATSFYVKPAARSWAYIQCNNGGGASAIYFDLAGAGTVGSIQTLSGSATIALGTIQALASGWYRIAAISFGCLGIYEGPTSANSTPNYTGTGTVAQYIWGAQLEAIVSNENAPTSYYPTTTTAATRSGDNITMSGVLASTLASPTGTIVVNTNDSYQSLAATIIDSNGTTLLGKTAGNLGTTSVGATLSTGNTGTWTGANDLGLAWNASGGAIQLNAGTIATDTTARTPAATFHLGSTSGSSAFFNGYFTRLTVYSTKQASPQ